MDLSGQTKPWSVIYLHGFASGIGSTKARYFQTKFVERGIDVVVPDLNVPTFEQMTLSDQLQTVDTAAAGLAAQSEIVLMGSSMGGLLAAVASRKLKNRTVKRLILMAPGFGIALRWRDLIGEEAMTYWQKTGAKSFFHYGLNKNMDLAYSFIEDLGRHQTDQLKVDVPTLVFHGLHDATVPIQKSREFSQINSSLVHLKELDDGHELTASLSTMWLDVERFLQIDSLDTTPD